MSETIRVPDHVRSMIDPDGSVLLDLERGKYFSLNAVGAEIWKRCEQGDSRSEILQHLRQVFPSAGDRLEQDLGNFVDSLAGRGLLHVTH